MVVPVLMTNCHSPEYPKNGPEIAQTITANKAIRNAGVLPVNLAYLQIFQKWMVS